MRATTPELIRESATPVPPPRGPIAREMALLGDGVERYCADSLALATLELGERARAMAGDLAWIGLFAMALGVGAGLASVALALSLSASMGAGWAFLAVGSIDAVVGAVGLAVAARRMQTALRR